MDGLRRTGDTQVTNNLARLKVSSRREAGLSKTPTPPPSSSTTHHARNVSRAVAGRAQRRYEERDRQGHDRAAGIIRDEAVAFGRAAPSGTKRIVEGGSRTLKWGVAKKESGGDALRKGVSSTRGSMGRVRRAGPAHRGGATSPGKPLSGGIVAQQKRAGATKSITTSLHATRNVTKTARVTTAANHAVAATVHTVRGAATAVLASKTALIATVVTLVAVALIAVVSILPSWVYEHEQQNNLCAQGVPGAAVQVDNLPAEAAGYHGDALKNAAVIMQVSNDLGLPRQAQVIGLITAMQESDLGRHPSTMSPDANGDMGIFQQRSLSGWYGSPDQLKDPAYAARAFFEGVTAQNPGDPGTAGGGGHLPGLKDIRGWETMRPAQAAQAVQRSRYPEAYAAHEATANQIITVLSGAGITVGTREGAVTCAGALGGEATGTRKAVVDAATSLLNMGLTYRMGAGGPNGPTGGATDCSGLTSFAWNKGAGLQFGRSAAQQWAGLAAYRVSPNEIQPGDLIFYAYGRLGNRVDHVGMYIGDGMMIESVSPAKPVITGPARLGGAGFVGVASPPAPTGDEA